VRPRARSSSALSRLWRRFALLVVLAVALLGAASLLTWRHETTAVRVAKGAAPVRLVVAPGRDAPGEDLEDLLSYPAPANVAATDEQNTHAPADQPPALETVGRASVELTRRSRRNLKNSTPSRRRRRSTAGSRSIPPTMETIFRGRK